MLHKVSFSSSFGICVHRRASYASIPVSFSSSFASHCTLEISHFHTSYFQFSGYMWAFLSLPWKFNLSHADEFSFLPNNLSGFYDHHLLSGTCHFVIAILNTNNKNNYHLLYLPHHTSSGILVNV